MPEGDTIHLAATRVRAAVGGRALQELALPRVAARVPAAGPVVAQVLSRGKYLLVHLDDGHVIVTHLKMTGSWEVVSPGRRPPPQSRLRVWLRTDSGAAACVDAPIAQWLDEAALRRHPGLRSLGPDLCAPDPDLDEVVHRVGVHASRGQAIAEVLLDQRVAAGIGNVYKSEVAFLHGLHPATPVEAVSPAVRLELWATARDLLVRNLTTAQRTTVPGRRPGSLWVYGRSGKPCRRCGTTIEADRGGRDPRITYWCPQCQPATIA